MWGAKLWEWEMGEDVRLMLGSQLSGTESKGGLFLRWEHKAGLCRKMLSLAISKGWSGNTR